jgi:nicotinate-nucleotide adenylyltransferase
LRVGVLGGAFNPPHIGHLVCAQEALVRLELDHVLLVPVGVAPHREVEEDPGPEERAGLCELAVEGDDRLRVSRVEVEREGPSYTADTLAQLGESGDELVLILGGDQAASLPGWHEPERVLEGCSAIAVAEREDFGAERVRGALDGLPGARERLAFFSMPAIGVSSTLVRERVRAGEPIRYLVPDRVAERVEASR